jgi:putative two-component system response regulator
VYTAIYLIGIAAVSWTARALARSRLALVRSQAESAVTAQREAVLVLARAAEAKDEVTGDHVARVGDLSAALAASVGIAPPTVEELRFAAMLHDVGKLHVPDAILMKPGPLTKEEWGQVRQHTIWGERILGNTSGFAMARRIARSHHENWDGSGYPDGLIGEGIPMAARIVHVTDVFDALYHRRPYKPAWELERCIDELSRGRGHAFDPELVTEFLALLERHPALTVRNLRPGLLTAS